MFDPEKAVLQWRENREREASLTPRELDELEDHLRAHVDLQLELDAALTPERAFATARRELGRATALSREFAKAGRPRWRRWLIAGWAMYAASWFLPVYRFLETAYGHELVGQWIGDRTGTALFLVMNLPMVMTLPALRRARSSRGRWLRRWVGAVGLGAAGALITAVVWGSISAGGIGWLFPPPFLSGFWSWSASFLCVAHALRLRAREWTTADAGMGRRSVGAPGDNGRVPG